MRKGLIGYPLGHSWSPEIHQFLTGEKYELIELSSAEFEQFMTNKDFDCLNVTIPYKEKVIQFIDVLSEEAGEIGAVNCIKKTNSLLYGYNTDAFGFRDMLISNQIDLSDKRGVILGSGGASKACSWVLDKMGCEFNIVSRFPKEGCISYQTLYESAAAVDFIINCTPVGMFPNVNLTPVDLDSFPNLTAVIDVVANPLQTKLMTEAEKKGIRTLGGFEMLVRQAYISEEIFLNRTLDEEDIHRCMECLRKEKQS